MTTAQQLKDIIDSALDRAKGDRNAASDLAMKTISADQSLYNQLTAPLFASAVRQAVSEAARERNARTYDAARESVRKLVSHPGARIQAAAKANVAALMDTYCLGTAPKVLGDATREELLSEAAMHHDYEQGNRTKRVWFEMLAKAMPAKSDKLLRDCLTEKRVRQTKAKAEAVA